MQGTQEQTQGAGVRKTVIGILVTLSACHLINDTLQAIIPAIYPMLKERFALTFTQVGLITVGAADRQRGV